MKRTAKPPAKQSPDKAAKTASSMAGLGRVECMTKEETARARGQLTPVLTHALEWINRYLLLHRSEILLVKGNLECGFVQGQHETLVLEDKQQSLEDGGAEVVMPDKWHKTYATCKSIPKYFVAHWLVSGPPGMTSGMVDHIDGFDPCNGIRNVFHFLLGVGEQTWWAPSLHIRLVLITWCKNQFDRVHGEKRVKALIDHTNTLTGEIDWPALLPFTLEWNREFDMSELQSCGEDNLPYVKKIKHKYFDVEVTVVGQRIDALNWEIVSHCSDMGAMFTNLHNSTLKPTLASFFIGDSGRWKRLHYEKEAMRTSSEAAKVETESAEELNSVGQKAEILTIATENKKAKVKEARAKRTPKTSMKSTMSVTVVPPLPANRLVVPIADEFAPPGAGS